MPKGLGRTCCTPHLWWISDLETITISNFCMHNRTWQTCCNSPISKLLSQILKSGHYGSEHFANGTSGLCPRCPSCDPGAGLRALKRAALDMSWQIMIHRSGSHSSQSHSRMCNLERISCLAIDYCRLLWIVIGYSDSQLIIYNVIYLTHYTHLALLCHDYLACLRLPWVVRHIWV